MNSKGKHNSPSCVIIAGPNGAGKTTFAREFLPHDRKILHFVNADLIASGISPLNPNLAKIQAARFFLNELDRLASEHQNFSFETTLSGLSYLERLRRWKAEGYHIEIIFLKLHSPEISLKRIQARVRQGGHDVPKKDVIRRFKRGWHNFHEIYRKLAHDWAVYDNSHQNPRLLEQGP